MRDGAFYGGSSVAKKGIGFCNFTDARYLAIYKVEIIGSNSFEDYALSCLIIK